MDRNQREIQRRREDTALNRALIWVAGAIILELALMMVNRFYFGYMTSDLQSIQRAQTVQSLLVGIRIVGLIGAVALGAFVAVKLFQGKGANMAQYAGVIACGVISFLCHISLAYQQLGVQMLLMLVPAFAGLALVYYLYQRDFFYCACFIGAGIVGLWMMRNSTEVNRLTYYIYLALMVVVIAGICFALTKAEKNGGVLELFGAKLILLGKKDPSKLAVASGLVAIGALLVSFLMGHTVAYYLIFALIAWLFALLVYYTVKMM